MNKGRLEAFSDGVIAIIITIMVLELKIPHGDTWAALQPLAPTFICYLLSFIYVGIYWNNHHHMLHASQYINGGILWANLHLLFWLSLVPFVTAWMGENHFTAFPVLCYGVVLLMSAIAYSILAQLLIRLHGKDSTLAQAMGGDTKGKASIVIYVLAIALAHYNSKISMALYTIVAIIWFVPDSRIEKKMHIRDEH